MHGTAYRVPLAPRADIFGLEAHAAVFSGFAEMSSRFELYQRVMVITDRFTAEGAPPGSVEYVIESYQDGAYEVEVSDRETAETVAQFVADPADLEAAPES